MLEMGATTDLARALSSEERENRTPSLGKSARLDLPDGQHITGRRDCGNPLLEGEETGEGRRKARISFSTIAPRFYTLASWRYICLSRSSNLK